MEERPAKEAKQTISQLMFEFLNNSTSATPEIDEAKYLERLHQLEKSELEYMEFSLEKRDYSKPNSEFNRILIKNNIITANIIPETVTNSLNNFKELVRRVVEERKSEPLQIINETFDKIRDQVKHEVGGTKEYEALRKGEKLTGKFTKADEDKHNALILLVQELESNKRLTPYNAQQVVYNIRGMLQEVAEKSKKKQKEQPFGFITQSDVRKLMKKILNEDLGPNFNNQVELMQAFRDKKTLKY